MITLGFKQFDSEDDAMIAARTTPLNQLAEQCGVKGEAYLYVNTDNQIEAAIVPADATPADEVEFIGRYHPAVSL